MAIVTLDGRRHMDDKGMAVRRNQSTIIVSNLIFWIKAQGGLNKHQAAQPMSSYENWVLVERFTFWREFLPHR